MSEIAPDRPALQSRGHLGGGAAGRVVPMSSENNKQQPTPCPQLQAEARHALEALRAWFTEADPEKRTALLLPAYSPADWQRETSRILPGESDAGSAAARY